MKTFCTYYLLLSFFVISSNVFAQSSRGDTPKYEISGTIIDSISGQPLSYANIGILKESDKTFVKGTTTDEKGYFEIKGILAGNYFARISYVGYNPPLLPVSVNGVSQKISFGIFRLTPSTQQLNAVEIQAQKPVYQYNAEKKIYNVNEDISIQSGVANDALQNAPGVWVDLEGNVTLRGVSNVEIWINDKPSRLSTDGLKSYLQQLPANALERIEVITNPSAKYSASGTGGIINIITKEKIKKNYFLSLGLNGSTKPGYAPWMSFLWSNEKWKINMYATHNYWKGKNDSHSENIIKNGTSPLYEYRNKGKSNYDGAWSYLYLNTEYQLSKKSTIEVYTGGSLYNGKYSYKSTAYKNDFSTNIWDSIQSLNDYDYGGQTSYYAGSSFNHNFNDKGHKLNIDLYGWGWDSSPEGNSSQIYTVETMNNKMRRNYPQNSSSSVNLNSDYTYPINDSTSIEAGINASTSHSKDMNMTDSLDFLTNTWHFDEQISDRYKDNDKNVNAYVSYNGKLWGVGYKIGVRSEYKEYHLNSISMNRQFTRDFFNLYPSLHLSYSTKGMDNFTLSYSRRVEYPDYQLNPYIDYSDVEWIYGGNPNLKSSYTNSFEAGYAKYFKKGGSFSVSLYHRYTDKDITYYTTSVYDTVLNRNTLYSTYANSGTNAFTGGEITANYQPAKFISLMANANLYNLKISAHMKTSDTSSYDIDRDNFSWDGKLSCNLTIVKTVKWQITGIYRSENKSLVGSSDPVYYINTSIRSDFFNRKLSVNVGVQDIFDWQKTKGTTSTPTYSGSSSNKQVTRYLTAGITLRLGKIEMEKEMKTGQDKSGKQ